MGVELIDSIIVKIRALEIEFQRSQGMILTEEDLQCHVFRMIHPLFHDDLETMDIGVRGSQLHSELKFFNDQDKLSIIPDLTILDTARLSIYHSVNSHVSSKGIKYEPFKTKQFEFGGDVTVIELKFCRDSSGITERDIMTYKSDLLKMDRLAKIMKERSQGLNKLNGLFVVFNKTDLKVSEFAEFLKLETENIKILYATGNVEFNEDRFIVKF